MTERLQEPALFDGNVSDDEVNLSKPIAAATTGEEFIKRVILEARQCEEVTRADINETLLKQKNGPHYLTQLPECAKAPAFISPTLEWQRGKVTDFSNVRLYIAQIRDEIKNCKRKKKDISEKLPNINDKKSWIDMCTTTNDKKSMYIEPTLTVILSMKQPAIEQVIEYLVEFLENQKFIQLQLGRWLYALLAALELPLNPDLCFCLRSLARNCSTIRSQLDPLSENSAVAFNLFICIVARYFRQLDLADS